MRVLGSDIYVKCMRLRSNRAIVKYGSAILCNMLFIAEVVSPVNLWVMLCLSSCALLVPKISCIINNK